MIKRCNALWQELRFGLLLLVGLYGFTYAVKATEDPLPAVQTEAVFPSVLDRNTPTFKHAFSLLQQQGASLDIALFERHPVEYQAYLLGSYSAQAQHYPLAIEWFNRAYADVDKLNEFSQQSLLYQLGYSYAQLGQLAESELWYRRAIAKGSADACVNLGASYEQRQQYQQAEAQYLSSLPDNESALLYLNLGTLYYNGLVKQDKGLGGRYWQLSAKLDPYDSDIQYNLGVYYLNTERDLDKARYYFSQCSWQESECASVLSHPLLIGRSAEQAHWQALRQGGAVEQRHRLEDRAKHLLPVPVYFDDETAEILLQVQLSDNGWQSITATTQSREPLEKACTWLNRLIWVDTFSGANAQTYPKLNSGTSMLPLEWQYQGLRYQVLEQNGRWQCSAYLLKSNE
ncbi:hypothetical protein [Shewanella xiamenensis]|uniref:Tetratricopeptide repeat protein n=1 Tax=Shewanella xiamenensis TaxID=332186 RepID=A0ABT6U8R5_9GAMM|nr:hypothetical protein [Shewanella xiamenensis]MDI5830854.1 hypothetical protein [Shewanella xiamenensis]